MRREIVARRTANNAHQLTGTGWFKILSPGKRTKRDLRPCSLLRRDTAGPVPPCPPPRNPA